MSNTHKIIIAIDGHSSCGKSTFAKAIAARLGYIFIDTGAMYRAVTLYALEHGAIPSGIANEELIEEMLKDINIDFRFNPARGASDIYVNGDLVESKIRTIEVSNCVSAVSSIGAVRQKLVAMQQEMGRKKGVVMDGRDIGTVVFPEAELKMELKVVEAGEDMPFDFINALIKDIGLDAYAELYSCEDGTRRITIVGDDASALIGHHGDTLDALQYLANLSANKRVNGVKREFVKITVDVEGYRAKREETLRTLARRMAEKVLRNKRSVMLEPMSAYERRIIHSEIQGIEGVSTNSIGSDSNRKIVIYLTDKKKSSSAEAKSDDSDVNE